MCGFGVFVAFMTIPMMTKVLTSEEKMREDGVDRKDRVRYADKCEVCKYLVRELEALIYLREEAGHANSEAWLEKALENVCDRLSEYRVYPQRQGSKRFARGPSPIFGMLNDLIAKGVMIDMSTLNGLVYEEPVEITDLKQQCGDMVESYVTDIRDWFHDENDDKAPLMQFLCQERVLRNDYGKAECLRENSARVGMKEEF